MSDNSSLDQMIANSSRRGRSPKYRKILLGLLVLWLFTFAALVVFALNAYTQKKNQAQTLAEQVTRACKVGDFGPGFSKIDEENLCHKAKKIAEDNNVSIGIQGPRGPQGEQGPPGIQGPQGLQGIMGFPGRNGKNGKDGDNGLSIPGPKGDQGPKGDTGDQGPKGDTGDQGPKGDTGDPGPSGLINFTTVGCDGPLIHSIAVSYDATTQTATITCS